MVDLRLARTAGRRLPRLRLLVALLLACLTALAATATGAGAAGTPAPPSGADRITFGIQPATRSGLDPTRAIFSYSATPGGVVNDYVAFRNYTDKPLTVMTYAGDALNDSTGAYDVLRNNRKSHDLGAWITLASKSVNIPGRTAVIVPFIVRLPANVEPGDHSAGIVASVITQQLSSKGNRVNVEDRVGARVYVRVSGLLRPSLEVRNLKTTYHDSLNPIGGGSASISYDVVNAGNVRLSAGQQLRVHSLLGGDAKAPALARIPELLPGSSIHLTARVTSVWPGFRVATTLTLTPASQRAFPVGGLHAVSFHASQWVLPWMLLLVLALLALALLAARWLLRRRRAKAAARTLAAPSRELVTAGASAPDRTSASEAAAEPPAGQPIDLRDAPPVEVDVRTTPATDLTDPVVDLREPPALDRRSDDDPPATDTRK